MTTPDTHSSTRAEILAELRKNLYPESTVQALIARIRFNLDLLDKAIQHSRDQGGILPRSDALLIKSVDADVDMIRALLRSEFSHGSERLGSPDVAIEFGRSLGDAINRSLNLGDRS